MSDPGQLDVGITGRDLLLDSGADAHEVMPLGFGASTFRFAALPELPSTMADSTGSESPRPTRASCGSPGRSGG